MPFDPKDFLKLSKDLLNDAKYNHESGFRTCISRAYYSAFLVCRTFLEIRHKISFLPTAEAHKKVVRNLRKRKVINTLRGSKGRRYAVADVLDKLRKKGRNVADYDLLASLKNSDAFKCIQDAEYVVGTIP